MVFRTIGIYVITSTFFTFFFQNPKSRDFLRFLPCYVRFLERWSTYRLVWGVISAKLNLDLNTNCGTANRTNGIKSHLNRRNASHLGTEKLKNPGDK